MSDVLGVAVIALVFLVGGLVIAAVGLALDAWFDERR